MSTSLFLPGRPIQACLLFKTGITIWLMLALMLVSNPAWSQTTTQSDSMPPWTVLALKLVSATHVQPTTGIVIAAPDMVLVAVDFARVGDEIMVLDGGTDIVRHGRPATIVHTLPADKLAILRVQGLNRPAAVLSALTEAEIKSLSLIAFPPAEMIAEGSAPVRSAVKVLPAITTSHPTLEPFPNVSGALADSCGNLMAFNMSVGVQSMQPTGSPRVAWPDALQRAAKLAGTTLSTADCSVTEVQAAEQQPPSAEPLPEPTPPPVEEDASPPEETAPPQPVEQALEPGEQDDPQPEAEPEPESEQQRAEANGELTIEHLIEEPVVDAPVLDPVIHDTAAAATPRQPSRATLILTGLIALLLLAWFIRRWRKSSVATGSAATGATHPAEPGTVRFEPDKNKIAAVSLQVSGHFADGEAFTRLLPVNGTDWYAELGRDDADVNLSSETVSRRHARIQIHQGRVTISDLGSTNGTRLNAVPCLPGEEFFVQSGDTLQLGDVSLSLQLMVSDS